MRKLRHPSLRIGAPLIESWSRRVTVVIAVLVLTGAVIAVAVSAGVSNNANVVGPLPLQMAAFVATPSMSSTTTSTTLAPTTTSTTATTQKPVKHSTPTAPEKSVPLPADGNSGRFSLGPGAALPSDSYCAGQVTSAKENRSANTTANHTKPSGKLPSFAGNLGTDHIANADLKRVDGNFTGTTDEIIQWASCKWGFDVDVTRAQAFIESSWHQGSTSGLVADQSMCVGGMTAPCPLAFGIMQLQANSQPHTYPYSASSTAFNLDYALAMRRACYDGHSWLGSQTTGDMWGCVGAFNTGIYPLGPIGKSYVAMVQNALAAKPWT